jgi:hypothetical protein
LPPQLTPETEREREYDQQLWKTRAELARARRTLVQVAHLAKRGHHEVKVRDHLSASATLERAGLLFDEWDQKDGGA